MTTNTGLKVVQPYLFFNGRCEEALNFYKKAVGAELSPIMRFKDAPPPPAGAGEGCGPGNFDPEKVMHTSFKIGQSEIMASDGCDEGDANFRGFSLSIAVDKEAEAERIFNALGEGGKVTMPLAQTFFAPKFGMIQDKFGVGWMVIVIPPGGHAPK